MLVVHLCMKKNGPRSLSAIVDKRNTVADAEALFPGSARWYHHPFGASLMWDTIEGLDLGVPQCPGLYRTNSLLVGILGVLVEVHQVANTAGRAFGATHVSRGIYTGVHIRRSFGWHW